MDDEYCYGCEQTVEEVIECVKGCGLVCPPCQERHVRTHNCSLESIVD